ncbi:MAG: M15 family metallopeptidase [Gammaproteobacteria bacterium]|nr:M15 family metallopeptidase [Gammaproteobacteria bacterium]
MTVDSEALQRQLAGLGISSARLESRGLHPFAEAGRLEVVQTDDDGREHQLTPEAAAAWRHLHRAAEEDGVILFIASAFRGIERQIQIIQRKLDAGQSLEAILAVNAPPGYSEHHSGRAVDIGTPDDPLLEASFADTPAFAWLVRRAGEFGFVLSYPEGNQSGYRCEPWHWCYHTPG